MTKDERIVNYKCSVLQHAREHKNIALTCKVFQISRTIYYFKVKQNSIVKAGLFSIVVKQKN